MEKKRIYISDVHLNAGKGLTAPTGKYPYEWIGPAGAKLFSKFVSFINDPSTVKEVVIIGDLLDDWVCPVTMVPPTLQQIINAPINKQVVRELKKLSSIKEISVIYLPGNHDMGVTQELVRDNFPGMVFGGTALYNSVYRTSRLRAEHGSAHAMFNAPDTLNSPGTRLPLGYFISRVTATKQYETGDADRHYWTCADDLLETLGPQKLAASLFEAVLEEAGLDEDVVIRMPSRRGKKDGLQAKKVKEKYARLYDQWQEAYGPGVAYKAVFAELGFLGKIADKLCKKSDTNVVILGHSHDWELDKDSWFVDDRIYANCGTWCEDDRPCTFVETQKDRQNGEHWVRVMAWEDGQAKVLKEDKVKL